jgi:mono/diheme cytochrome c family protein
MLRRVALVVCAAAVVSCEGARESAPLPAASSAASSAAVTPTRPKTPPVEPSATRTGSSVAWFDGDLILADEPHHALYLPLRGETVALAGRPAQMVRVGASLFVTIRDAREGGLVVELVRDGEGPLHEKRRVAVAYDAWGIAASADGASLVVTSPWSNVVTGIDASAMKVRWSMGVGREPRGVVLTSGGVAWVSHLVSASLDRIDGAVGDAPKRKLVDLPAAPLRSKGDTEGSLGYALALSADGTRLFAPRHALGAFGRDAWFGVASVDVLTLDQDRPLVPRAHGATMALAGSEIADDRLASKRGTIAIGALAPFTQPRAVDHDPETEALFVLGEGDGALVELDAEALDPSVVVRHRVLLGSGCSGAAGMARAKSEIVVQCAASFTWMRVPLPLGSAKPELRTYADDPLPPDAAAGRRAFVDATDDLVSGGLACAGCHPEGRDDGHVWHEIDTKDSGIDLPFDVGDRVFVSGVHVAENEGRARQTPMLAGRVDADGPYGWRAESKTLEARIIEGTDLHRWRIGTFDEERKKLVAHQIALYLRRGLDVPPALGRALTEQEKLGKAIFERRDVGCVMCHGDGGDGVAHRIFPWPTQPGFVGEYGDGFKTPNLRFVSHTAPYFHDGSATTLEQLVDEDEDRMGKTSQLNASEKKALAAYLRTL